MCRAEEGGGVDGGVDGRDWTLTVLQPLAVRLCAELAPVGACKCVFNQALELIFPTRLYSINRTALFTEKHKRETKHALQRFVVYVFIP